MGLMKKIAAKTVAKGAEKAVNRAVIREANKRRSINAQFEKCQLPNKLIVEKHAFSLKKSSVLDVNNKKKYIIKSNNPLVGKHCYKLYSAEEIEIGSVWKAPFLPCYSISLHGDEIGSVTKVSGRKILFETDRANWNIKGNLMQLDYEVLDEENNIRIKVHSAFWSNEDSYVMEYTEVEDEELGLLLLMVIALIRSN